MKHILPFILAFILSLSLQAQNYIGMHKSKIHKVLSNANPYFKLNKDVINNSYKYLKYEDKINEQTILFFLSPGDTCTYVRHMCDYSNLTTVIDSLDNKYVKLDKNTWSYQDGKEEYIITLTEEEWFFTVSTRRK